VADNKVVFEVRATSSGFEVVQKQQKELAGAVDKTNTKQKNLTKLKKKTMVAKNKVLFKLQILQRIFLNYHKQ
jgi:hypothetical protein